MNNRTTGIALSYTSTILNMVAGLFLSSFLLRQLGDFEYGLYQTISSFISYLVILEFGVGTVICRNLLVSKNSNDILIKKKITSTMWYFSLILSAIIVIIGIVFLLCIPSIYSETIPQEKISYAMMIFAILLPYLICSFLTQTVSGAFLGNDDYTSGNIINITKVILRTGVLIGLIIPFNKGIIIATIDATISFVILVISIVLVVKKHGFSFNIKFFDKKILKGSLMLCFALLLQAVINQTNTTVGKFIVSINMTMESVALYSIPVYIYTMFSSFTTIPISLYMPQVAKDIGKGVQGRDLENTLVPSSKLVVLIGGSILFGFVAFGRQFINVVYGDSYTLAWLITLIVIVPMFVNMTSGCAINVLDVLNKRQIRSYILLGTTALNIALTILLINFWGLIGVAIATSLSLIIGQVIIMNIYYKKSLNINIWRIYWNSYKRIIPCQFVAMAISGVVSYFISNDLLALFAGGCLFIAIEFLLLMLFGLNRNERNSLLKKIKRLFKRKKSLQNGVVDEMIDKKAENSEINLDKLKQVELNMLNHFIEICKKHELKYFMLGGTCLGAVRHNGFIPWDDDIDVGMPRQDYEKFLVVAKDELPEYIFLQTINTDKEYLLGFSKLRDSRTTFIETASSFLNINHGVFIDIFPLDGYKNSRIDDYKRKLYASRISQEFLRGKSNKKTFKYILTNILVGKSKKASNKMYKIVMKYDYNQYPMVANYYGAWGKKEIMPKQVFGDGVEVKFEGIDVIIPQNYDEYLTRLYGDYMQLPPIEKRVTHHYTEVVDFDKPYTYYFAGIKEEK